MLLFEEGFDETGLDGIGLELRGFGTNSGALGETVGLLRPVGFDITGLFGIFVSGLAGRGSESSAFRFVPPALPLGGSAGRTAGGFRSSFLGVIAGAGEAGAGDSGS